MNGRDEGDTELGRRLRFNCGDRDGRAFDADRRRKGFGHGGSGYMRGPTLRAGRSRTADVALVRRKFPSEPGLLFVDHLEASESSELSLPRAQVAASTAARLLGLLLSRYSRSR